MRGPLNIVDLIKIFFVDAQRILVVGLPEETVLSALKEHHGDVDIVCVHENLQEVSQFFEVSLH